MGTGVGNRLAGLSLESPLMHTNRNRARNIPRVARITRSTLGFSRVCYRRDISYYVYARARGAIYETQIPSVFALEAAVV